MLRGFRDFTGRSGIPALLYPVLLVVASWAAQAQTFGRVTFFVMDEAGDPVPTTVTVDCDKGHHDEKTTNKRGKVTLAFADATQMCLFRLEAEGFAPQEIRLSPPIGSTQVEEVTLRPVGEEVVDIGEGKVATYTPAQVAFNEGVDLLRAGDLDAAETKFQEALDKDSDLTEVHSALAVLYGQRGEYEKSLASAETFIDAAGANPQILRVVYTAHRELGNRAEAEKVRQALAEAGQGRDAAAFAYNEGVAAIKVGDDAAAKELFEEALHENPEMVPAMVGLAAILLREGSFEEALPHVEKGIALEPDNETLLRMRLEAYRALGDEAKAKEAFAALAAEDPKAIAEEFYERGVQLFEAGDAAGAAKQFESVLEIDPENARAHYHLGLSYSSVDEKELAKQHFEKFLAMAPDDPEAPMAKEMLSYLD